MNNAEIIKKYMDDYSEDFLYEHSECCSYEICGISAKIDVWEYDNGREYREKAHVLLEKGSLKYECECIDRHDWANMFYPIIISGKAYLCFRKTLYGFSFIDVESLTEEYEFFPEKVIRWEESFIICDAKMLGDIIIFDGCYWACPYSCVAYDYRSGLFVNLSLEYGIGATDIESEIREDVLIIHGMNGDYSKTVTCDDVRQLLKEKGNTDF